MIPPRVIFVPFERSRWNSFPADRTCSELSADLLGIERKIRKGVAVQDEQRRYILLMERMESLARQTHMELRDARALTLSYKASRAYIALTKVSVIQGELVSGPEMDATASVPNILLRLLTVWKIETALFRKIWSCWMILRSKSKRIPDKIFEIHRPFATVFPHGTHLETFRHSLRRLRVEVLPALSKRVRLRKITAMVQAVDEVERFLAQLKPDCSIVILVEHAAPTETGVER